VLVRLAPGRYLERGKRTGEADRWLKRRTATDDISVGDWRNLGPTCGLESFGRILSSRAAYMGTDQDYLKCAEACLEMAQAANDDTDQALWLMLGQSWVGLAEHVAGSAAADEDEGVPALEALEGGVSFETV
jgi:hypothetical protein